MTAKSTRLKRTMCCLACTAAAAGAALGQSTAPAETPSATQPVEPLSDIEIVGRYVDAIRAAQDTTPAAHDAVTAIWQGRRPEDDARTIMASVLSIVSPAFKQATDAIDAGRYAQGRALLQPILDSDDLQLRTHARLLAARSLVEEDRPEQALTVLEALDADRDRVVGRTLGGAELLFLLGYCQLTGLRYDAALETLRAFEQRYPMAPDELRLPVRQMIQELAARKPDGLGDVSDLMTHAGRHLRHVNTGEPAQSSQQRAIELLGKLIEEAEQREQQQRQQQQQQQQQAQGRGDRAQGSGQAQGNQPSQQGAQRSTLPGGRGRFGDLRRSAQARPGEQWGKMRPEERERILQAVRQNFPSRYRQLIEQYYEQLGRQEQ